MLKFIASDEALEWATGALVFIVAVIVGAYAAQGLNGVQWAGAGAALLGSITLAVLVRVWPAEQEARTQQD